MKKILVILFLSLMFCNTGFAESYYFKECKLTDTYSGNYLIDLDKNVINVSLVGADGSVQEKTYLIKSIKKDKIITEKKQHATRKEFYFEYHLDAKSKSVGMQKYRKKHEGGLYSLEGPRNEYLCENVKANWDKSKKEGVASNKAQEKSLQVDSSLPKCQGSDPKQWKNCQGFYTAENGYKYNGQFKEGKILKGSAIYPSGAKYVGKFKDDKPHGQGIFTYPDGSKHFGEWKAGVGHGHGIKTWKDGRKYVGKFKDDKPHEQGTFTYPDGSKYVGQYKDGKRHGEGTLTYSDGKTYMGQFVAGYEYGEGICINQDGSSVNCKMDNISKVKNMHNISIVGKKWIKISKYKTTSGEQLKTDFDKRAYEICSSTGNFNILEKKVEVFEMDETPAFGLETVVKLGISGVVECI